MARGPKSYVQPELLYFSYPKSKKPFRLNAFKCAAFTIGDSKISSPFNEALKVICKKCRGEPDKRPELYLLRTGLYIGHIIKIGIKSIVFK